MSCGILFPLIVALASPCAMADEFKQVACSMTKGEVRRIAEELAMKKGKSVTEVSLIKRREDGWVAHFDPKSQNKPGGGYVFAFDQCGTLTSYTRMP